MFKYLPLALLLLSTPALAQNITCPTRPVGTSDNSCASTAFVANGFIPNTGGFTPNLPVIGSAGGGLAQGTRSGTTTVFPVIDGTSTSGQCAVFDANGGLTSVSCTPSGSGNVTAGTIGQIAVYTASTTVAGGTLSVPQYTNLTNGTGVPRNLQLKLDDFVSAKDYGAKGDGSTDDTTALNTWITAIQAQNKCGYLPAGVYIITASISTTTGALCIHGAGQYLATITYNGASTTLNAFSINCASACYNIDLEDFKITSNVTMTAGFAFFFNNINYSTLRNIGVSQFTTGVASFFNGVEFANSNFITWTGGDVYVSHNGIEVFSGVELSLDQMRLLNNGNAAIHVGGGFGGLYLGYVSVFGGQFGLLVDTANVSVGNAQIFISNRTVFDNDVQAGIFLNDALTSAKSISMDGWAASCTGAGCNGIAIDQWLQGDILVGGGAHLISNAGNGIADNDPTAFLSTDPAALISANGGAGIGCGAGSFGRLYIGGQLSTGFANAGNQNAGGYFGPNCHGFKPTVVTF